MGPEVFDYTLPPELIAQAPAPRRADARCLVVGPPHRDATVRALPELLPPGALVVVNESAVVPARVRPLRDDGRAFELLLCEPDPEAKPGASIRAWVRGAKKLRPDDRLSLGDVTLRYLGVDGVDPRARRFELLGGDLLDACRAHGEVPLPPYIARAEGPSAEDAQRYQTVFAGARGSVAAPTAGLHLDEALMEMLDPVRITLHVGPGTFLPMDVADVREHRVGSERFEVSPRAAARIEAARAEGRPIVAVGTTVTRTLEALGKEHGTVVAGRGTTDLVITPEHRFGVVTHLLTNFHLPRSSLLMLTCSFGGRERVLDGYAHAVASRYRFYSYGDCMLLGREER